MEEAKSKIFIVHGHDEAKMEALARIIERNGYEAIILNEQLNKGKTIIEKLEEYTDVDFGFIIYTPCDEGSKKDGILEPRSRQNVIFEHGYLIGKLGREKTAVLYEKGVVEPSDISGLGYTPLDSNGAWKGDVEKILNDLKANKNQKTTQLITPENSELEIRVKFKKLLINIDDGRLKMLCQFYKNKNDAIISHSNNPNLLSLIRDGYLTDLTPPNMKDTYVNTTRLNDDIKDILYEYCKKNEERINKILNNVETKEKPSVQTLNLPDPSNTFRDPRDNRLYRTVQIGDRIWMAENFDYKGDGTVGRYYNDDPELGKIYGRLYTWDEAIRIAPLGWNLPKMVEWADLIHSTGKENAGYRLKTREGWNKGENGNDDYGFSALPGGYLSTGENEFSLIGSRAAWWVNSPNRTEKTYVKFIENKGNDCYIADYEDYKINMFSVRYVKDRIKSW